MVKFTTHEPDTQDKQVAFQLNNKMIELECDLHPYELSVVSVSFADNETTTYKIESVCCERFRPFLELYLDRHK